MEHTSHEEIKKHVKVYLAVFIALALLTVVTVFISYLRLPLAIGVVTALLIASVKGSLVAGFFMHLVSEKRIIFSILILAAIFFLVLLILPTIS